MDNGLAEWAGGSALLLAALMAAVFTTRVLLGRTTHTRPAVPALLSLLTTTALAVTGAALWATPGRSLGHTWPFAIAMIIAATPLVAAAIRRRRATPDTTTSGRRAPQ